MGNLLQLPNILLKSDLKLPPYEKKYSIEQRRYHLGMSFHKSDKYPSKMLDTLVSSGQTIQVFPTPSIPSIRFK